MNVTYYLFAGTFTPCCEFFNKNHRRNALYALVSVTRSVTFYPRLESASTPGRIRFYPGQKVTLRVTPAGWRALMKSQSRFFREPNGFKLFRLFQQLSGKQFFLSFFRENRDHDVIRAADDETKGQSMGDSLMKTTVCC